MLNFSCILHNKTCIIQNKIYVDSTLLGDQQEPSIMYISCCLENGASLNWTPLGNTESALLLKWPSFKRISAFYAPGLLLLMRYRDYCPKNATERLQGCKLISLFDLVEILL
ncbi:hypothetical protein CEXT_402891 [Caerostris extrusa]|uniref:Uncharacterized protein n=1 Tax=Caerostris extrusa TaxID=172846 RepID=A0AAV4QTY7_CAEEX|nr:hypothetical protein CEXT_402891 [Caerostris extrusa]